jgi:hypothetical protein
MAGAETTVSKSAKSRQATYKENTWCCKVLQGHTCLQGTPYLGIVLHIPGPSL